MTFYVPEVSLHYGDTIEEDETGSGGEREGVA